MILFDTFNNKDMQNLDKNLKVAILICTRDRPDFMIRAFNYYTKLNSPHPIYVADSSNDKNVEVLKTVIEKVKNKLTVNYSWYPPGPDNHGSLLKQVTEKYACVISDDDYQIPNSLSKCAQFLENNPDYAAAGGRAVSFRLKEGGPYGELQRLAYYPRYSIESETARQRVIDFMKAFYSISFFVNRVDNMRKTWELKLNMSSSMNELVYYNHCIIPGKSKLIDCLSLVRQIHNQRYLPSSTFDWMASRNFCDDYSFFKKNISEAIAKKDKIDVRDAEEIVRESFLDYMSKMLAYEHRCYVTNKYHTKNTLRKNLRTKVGRSFPILKRIYRNYVRPFLTKDLQLHHEVLQPSSKYYTDFKPILDSFTGSSLKNPSLFQNP